MIALNVLTHELEHCRRSQESLLRWIEDLHKDIEAKTDRLHTLDEQILELEFAIKTLENSNG